jgi:hypothetical protein
MDDLRELFHRLRDEELPVAGFQLPAGNRQRATGNRWRAAVATALVVIAIVVVAFHHHRPPAPESIVTWKAPTDFLLRTPGSEVLSTVPQIPERR